MSKQRNHTVPQVLQRQFSFSNSKHPNSDMVCIMDLILEDGGCRSVNSTFYSKGFYDEELEKRMSETIENELGRRIESIIQSIKNRPDENSPIEMRRGDVDFFKKMLLVQIIRTPQRLKDFLKQIKSDIRYGIKLFSDDIENLESPEEMWIRMLKKVVNTSWKDMDNTGFKTVSNIVSVINRTSPVLFITDIELILPDSGFFIEVLPISSSLRLHSPDDYIKAFGTPLQPDQIYRISLGETRFVNFYGIPISNNIALLFVDDYWNAYRISKKAHIPVINVLSSKLSGQLAGSIIVYKTPGVEWTMEHGHDVESPHDDEDIFLIPVKPIPGRYANEINCMSLDNAERIVAFHDVDKVKKSFDYYNKVGGKHNISFYKDIDFTKEYSTDLFRNN